MLDSLTIQQRLRHLTIAIVDARARYHRRTYRNNIRFKTAFGWDKEADQVLCPPK